MKRGTTDNTGDLFSSQAETRETPPAIVSPLVDEAREMLAGRTLTLGNLLASERAFEYVACLAAFADFRVHHEPEPLHEDLEEAVCGEDASPGARSAFKSDIRQLKDWGLVTERIEKERLRGYRDARRTKFRYKMCDDAAAFVEWLKERREYDLNPTSGDETGNLLDIQRSLTAELRRMLRKVNPAAIDYDCAGDVMFRADRLRRNIDATAKVLQELNLRLLSFGAAAFEADEAKRVVQELGIFLERFGRRFGEMREDILRDILEMRRDCHVRRWQACAQCLKNEAAKFKYIASVKVPDAERILADAEDFYAAGGRLAQLMSRIGDSARKVWGKLNAKLRELERRNHRLEDLAERIADLARLGDADVPHEWMVRLMAPANMRGDSHIRPSGEKSIPPRPKSSSSSTAKSPPGWIVPRKVGEKADIRSISRVKADRLKDWMLEHGIYPPAGRATTISAGEYSQFQDFRNIVELIEYIRLSAGDKGRRFLGLEGREMPRQTCVEIGNSSLSFDDVEVSSFEFKVSNSNLETRNSKL